MKIDDRLKRGRARRLAVLDFPTREGGGADGGAAIRAGAAVDFAEVTTRGGDAVRERGRGSPAIAAIKFSSAGAISTLISASTADVTMKGASSMRSPGSTPRRGDGGGEPFAFPFHGELDGHLKITPRPPQRSWLVLRDFAFMLKHRASEWRGVGGRRNNDFLPVDPTDPSPPRKKMVSSNTHVRFP